MLIVFGVKVFRKVTVLLVSMLILPMIVMMVLTVLVLMGPETVLVLDPMSPRVTDPPGRVLGQLDPVIEVRNSGEYSRQPRLAALRPVGHQPDKLGPVPLTVCDQGGARVPGTRTPEVLPDDAHLSGTHLLLALPEVVLLHAHGGEVECPRGVEAVQAPAPDPGRGAGGQRGAGQGDGAHPGRGGGGADQLQQRDVIGEGGVTPGGPVRAPQAAGALGLLVVRPDDDPLDGDAHPVLALAPVTPQPHLDPPPVHHDPIVIPGDAMSGRQYKPVRYESSTAGSPTSLGPRPLECGLKLGYPGPTVRLGYNSSVDSLCSLIHSPNLREKRGSNDSG